MNYYQVLDLNSACSREDIIISYKRLCDKHHPEVNNGQNGEEAFKNIFIAAYILCDKKVRRLVDKNEPLKDSEQAILNKKLDKANSIADKLSKDTRVYSKHYDFNNQQIDLDAASDAEDFIEGVIGKFIGGLFDDDLKE